MAALTWREVSAPDYRGVQSSINSAADLLSRSTNGMSGALSQFGDQQALQKLAQYSDAQKLQADIQSGQFSTANASPEALAAIMGRPTALNNDTISAQNAAFRKEYNPLLLEKQSITNNQSLQDLAQDKDNQNYLQTVARPNAEVDRTRADALWQRAEDTRKLLDVAQVDINTRITDGSLSTINQGRELLKSLSNGPKEVTDFYAKTLSSRFPGLTAPPVATPLASGINSFGSNTQVANGDTSVNAAFDPVVLGNAIYGQESSSGKADTTKVNSQNVTGPMQVQEATFEGLKKNGVIPANYDWKNPEHNKAAGFAHIADLSKTYKTPEQVAAVYYSGPDAVNADGSINRDRKNLKRPNDPTVGEYVDQVMVRSNATPTNLPTTEQLSNRNAADIALNNMAKVGANVPEVERWLAATATQGNGSLADVANELKKGSLNTVPMNRIQEMLQQVAAKTNTTGDARLAGEILKSSLAGNSTFRFGFGTDTFGFNPDFSDKLIAENIKKYNDRSKTTDSIQTGRALDQGSAALLESQKQVEASKANLSAKKNELATGVYGVTQGDVIQADAAVQQALAKSVQIQEQIENFRPKTKSETKPVQATPAADIIAAQVTPKVTTLGTYSYAQQKAEAEAALKLKREQRKVEKDMADEQERQDAIARARVIKKTK